MGQPPPATTNECSHTNAKGTVLFRCRDYISGDWFTVVECPVCGLDFTSPQPTDWNRYYPPSYYGAQESQRFPSMVEKTQDALYSWRVRAIERTNGGRSGRVLDIGCGRGLLLKQFRERGWEVQGTELDSTAAAYGREVLNLPIKTGELKEMTFPDNHFDTVVMWHVLEHIPAIEEFLTEVARILKPGGIFFVAVPNFGSLEARCTKESWFHLDVPRHLNHFTPQVLMKKLAAAGFTAEKESYFAPEYDLFSVVQSSLNRLGIRHNLLYNFLRKRKAKVIGAETTPGWQLALTLILTVPLSGLGLLATIILAACKQGATITIFARKNTPPTGSGSAHKET